MKLNIPFNGSLRLIYHDRIDQDIFDTFKAFGSIVFGKVPIEWIVGDRDQNDTCHSAICSTPFLQSIQSGLSDASFPAEAMDQFSLVPENMSFSSMIDTQGCGFVNLYTETSVKSKYLGILTSFQVIHLNVYILIGFLFALGVYIYSVRKKSLPWPFKGITKQLIDGKFGFTILVTCYLAVYHVYELLSSTFTTNYSIQSRDAPLLYLDDLNKSTQSVVSIQYSYCTLNMKDNTVSSQNIKTADSAEFFSYIHDHLFDDRIVLFETVQAIKSCIRIFCNFMINVKKNANFYIHASNQRYFNTARLLVYHKFLEKSKKVFLQRAAYSCVEMGFCLDGLDQAIRMVLEKRITIYKTCAQCKRYEQIESYPMAYHPIAFITIKDALYLSVLLMALSSFVFLIELIRSSNRNRWYNISEIKTFSLRKLETT
uniref:Uncharacterized protein n=1 Tax=Tetranychus urticae TaxID=32264 RepID=T1JY46_TETUR